MPGLNSTRHRRQNVYNETKTGQLPREFRYIFLIWTCRSLNYLVQSVMRNRWPKPSEKEFDLFDLISYVPKRIYPTDYCPIDRGSKVPTL